MKKYTTKILAIVMTVISVIGIFAVSIPAFAASKNPWDNYPEPTKAIYYKSPTMKGNDVKWVQQALNTTINAGLSIDGSFGPACKKATIAFQKKYKISQDGSFGPTTRSKMISVLNSLGYYKNSNNQTTKSNLIWPIANGAGKVTAIPGSRNYEKHVGTDIGTGKNNPDIIAVASGHVVAVGYTNARGYYATIRHGEYICVYQHMKQKAKVKAGTSVSQGQTIGYVGNTGHSSGNHLHFEIVIENTLSKKNSLTECLWADVNYGRKKPTYYSVSRGSKVGSYYKLNIKQV